MERNTIATLGQLRIGDRFCYLKRVDIWQVIGKAGNIIEVNQVVDTNDGKKLRVHQFNEIKKPGITVKFVRHTVPVIGEPILIMDLNEGDSFYPKHNPAKEYSVIRPDSEPYYWMQSVQSADGETIQLQKSDVVIYAGKKEVTHEHK